MYRFFVNDPIRFKKSIRMTIEHGHANTIANDYSSTVFWYQTEPSTASKPLPPAMERRPRDGRNPHDRAWATLLALRDKAFTVWFGSLTSGVRPETLARLMKHDISQSYLRRDYAKVRSQAAVLSTRLDAYQKGLRPTRTNGSATEAPAEPRRSSRSRPSRQ